jgi:hypothetical protein
VRLAIGIIGVCVVSAVAGWIIFATTESATASYIVAVASMAVGAVAVLVTLRAGSGQRIDSKVRARDLKDTTVTSVSVKQPKGSISSKIDAKGVQGGQVSGVRED